MAGSDDLGFGHYFDMDSLILYAYKLKILERWKRFIPRIKKRLTSILQWTVDKKVAQRRQQDKTMEEKRIGLIEKVSGNMVAVRFKTYAIQNEVAFVIHGQERLKSEVIRLRGNIAELQVYENTGGLKIGEEVEFTGELLSVELGPGLLSQIFDGLQNPLPVLAEECGFFLKRGTYLKALPDASGFHANSKSRRLLRGEKIRLCAGDAL
jgi:hypothetical protein